MKLLKTIKHSDLFPTDKTKYFQNLKIRKAARAVVLDKDGFVAILNVENLNYHKLPGGGIEEGENLAKALEREVLEEIGCKILVISEVGKIIEFKNRLEEKQESYCFLANVVGEKGQPNFTEEEIKNGFKILWVTMDEAIDILKNDKPDDYQGKFIKKRDLCFLEEAMIIWKK